MDKCRPYIQTMRLLLAAILVAALPVTATAEVFSDENGRRWDLITPPAHWFAKPAPPRILVDLLPKENVAESCRWLTGKAGEFGCALVLPHQCTIRVAKELPEPFRDAIVHHERAHCHGWPGDHPTE
jgi:hypothetical protein